MPQPRLAELTERPLASMSELAARAQAAFLTYEAARVVLNALSEIQYDHRYDTKEREIEPTTSYLIQPREGSAYKSRITDADTDKPTGKPVTRKRPFLAKSCEVMDSAKRFGFVDDGNVALVYGGDEGELKVPASELAEIEIFEMREGEVFSVWPPQAEVPAALTSLAEAIQ